MKLNWPAHSTYYHIMIDRFATDCNHFDFTSSNCYERQLLNYLGGNLHGITKSLDYLQWLGINAIILTPFFRGSAYHGYWISDLEQVDPSFGTARQLKHLIQQAHQRNIRVLMDLPITHCHANASLAQQARNNKRSPLRKWFYIDDDGNFTGFFGDSLLPELNLQNPELVKYLKKIVSHWLNLGFDGIRFDHAKRPSRSFWKDFTGYLRKEHPDVFLLGENWRESGHVGSLSPYLDSELNIPLSDALRQFARHPGKPTLQQIIELVKVQKPVRQQGYLLPTFLDNHDLERISHLAKNNAATIALVYLIQLTLPYPPIIYYGSERAQKQTANFSAGHHGRDRYFREPMDWHRGQLMADWLNRLIRFRSRYIDWFLSEPVVLTRPHQEGLVLRYQYRDQSLYVCVNPGGLQQEFYLAATAIDRMVTSMPVFIRHHNNGTALQLPGGSGAIVVTPACHGLKTTSLPPGHNPDERSSVTREAMD